MVDIHSHIVYGVDDGAKTMENSVAMLEMAAKCGTTDIVATPHSDQQYQYDPKSIIERIAEMQAAMGDRISIHRGCDFHLHFDNIRNCEEDRERFTINGQRYLMVEFAESSIPKNIAYVFQDMLRRDITPVITHPERNALLMGRVRRNGGMGPVRLPDPGDRAVVHRAFRQESGRRMQTADAPEHGSLRRQRRSRYGVAPTRSARSTAACGIGIRGKRG